MRIQWIINRLLLAGVTLALFAGCGGSRKWEDLPADVAWQRVMRLYEKHRYLDVVDRLEIFLINYSAASMADSAQYILAEAHFNMKEYIVAASEYDKMEQQYPQSPLAEISGYKKGLCYFNMSPKTSLDQDYTTKAIDTFQLFIEDYPDSKYKSDATQMIEQCREKLAKKEFENGRLYQKMGEYSSARMYFDGVLQNYYDTSFAPQALYFKAMAFEGSTEWGSALESYTSFLDKYPGNELESKTLARLNKVREKLKESETAQADSTSQGGTPEQK